MKSLKIVLAMFCVWLFTSCAAQASPVVRVRVFAPSYHSFNSFRSFGYGAAFAPAFGVGAGCAAPLAAYAAPLAAPCVESAPVLAAPAYTPSYAPAFAPSYGVGFGYGAAYAPSFAIVRQRVFVPHRAVVVRGFGVGRSVGVNIGRGAIVVRHRGR